jgi:hydrogenase maturation protease
MSVKVISIGNVLMKDDAIAIEVTRKIEKVLLEKGIEVICGETDFEYCVSKVSERDYLFIIDAANFGRSPGEVTFLPLNSFDARNMLYTQHCYSFLDLLKLFFPHIQGELFAIEVQKVEFGFGLSVILQEKLEDICEKILNKIESIIEVNK